MEVSDMENKLFDLAAKRRSVRRYTNEPISDEVLNEIMKVALTAPCSFGHRPVARRNFLVTVRTKHYSSLSAMRDSFLLKNILTNFNLYAII